MAFFNCLLDAAGKMPSPTKVHRKSPKLQNDLTSLESYTRWHGRQKRAVLCRYVGTSDSGSDRRGQTNTDSGLLFAPIGIENDRRGCARLGWRKPLDRGIGLHDLSVSARW